MWWYRLVIRWRIQTLLKYLGMFGFVYPLDKFGSGRRWLEEMVLEETNSGPSFEGTILALA